jgi:hypothetical protein
LSPSCYLKQELRAIILGVSEWRRPAETPRPAAKRDSTPARNTNRPRRRRRNLRASWTQHILAWALPLEGQLSVWPLAAEPPPGTLAPETPLGALDRIGQIRLLINHAKELARFRPSYPPSRLAQWWTGSRVEECRSLLQEAEIRMAGEGGPLFEASVANALRAAERLDPDSEPVRRLYAMVGPSEGAAT